MKLQIEKWERWFLYATAVMLAAFLVAIFASIGEANIHLPSDADQISPRDLSFDDTAGNPVPFNELGVFPVTGDPEIDYRAVLLAQAWSFSDGSGDAVPNLQVPLGSRVEFVVTTVDTIHGILISDVAVNAMIIPGQITRVVADFDEPGTHQIICHEFCGLLHHNMYATVEVVK